MNLLAKKFCFSQKMVHNTFLSCPHMLNANFKFIRFCRTPGEFFFCLQHQRYPRGSRITRTKNLRAVTINSRALLFLRRYGLLYIYFSINEYFCSQINALIFLLNIFFTKFWQALVFSSYFYIYLFFLAFSIIPHLPGEGCYLLCQFPGPPPPLLSSSSRCLPRPPAQLRLTIHSQCSLLDLIHDHPWPLFPAGPK